MNDLSRNHSLIGYLAFFYHRRSPLSLVCMCEGTSIYHRPRADQNDASRESKEENESIQVKWMGEKYSWKTCLLRSTVDGQIVKVFSLACLLARSFACLIACAFFSVSLVWWECSFHPSRDLVCLPHHYQGRAREGGRQNVSKKENGSQNRAQQQDIRKRKGTHTEAVSFYR